MTAHEARVDVAPPLTVREAAEFAGCHEHTVRRAIERGDLVAYRRQGSSVIQIRPEDFERWVYGDRVAVRLAEPPDGARARRSRPPAPRGSLARLRAIDRGDG